MLCQSLSFSPPLSRKTKHLILFHPSECHEYLVLIAGGRVNEVVSSIYKSGLKQIRSEAKWMFGEAECCHNESNDQIWRQFPSLFSMSLRWKRCASRPPWLGLAGRESTRVRRERLYSPLAGQFSRLTISLTLFEKESLFLRSIWITFISMISEYSNPPLLLWKVRFFRALGRCHVVHIDV